MPRRLTHAEMVARIKTAHRNAPISAPEATTLAIQREMLVQIIRSGESSWRDASELADTAATWGGVADRLHAAEPREWIEEAAMCMAALGDVVCSLIERYARTRRVRFAGEELRVVSAALGAMDALTDEATPRMVEECRREWERKKINVMRAAAHERAAARRRAR